MKKRQFLIFVIFILSFGSSFGQLSKCNDVEIVALKFFVDSIYTSEKYDISKHKIKYSNKIVDNPVMSDIKRNHCFKENGLLYLVVSQTQQYKKDSCDVALDKQLFKNLHSRSLNKENYHLNIYRRLKVGEQYIVSFVLGHKFGEIRFDVLLDSNLNVVSYCKDHFNI